MRLATLALFRAWIRQNHTLSEIRHSMVLNTAEKGPEDLIVVVCAVEDQEGRSRIDRGLAQTQFGDSARDVERHQTPRN